MEMSGGPTPTDGEVKSRKSSLFPWLGSDGVQGLYRPQVCLIDSVDRANWSDVNAWIRALAGFLLLAHGAVHLLYLVPEADDSSYPFTLQRSWVVAESARRPVALALIGLTLVASTMAALAIWGVPGLAGIWPLLVIIASSLSALLLILFFDQQLVLGLLIDAALIVIAVVRPGWADF